MFSQTGIQCSGLCEEDAGIGTMCVFVQFKCTWTLPLFHCFCAMMVFDDQIYCFKALKVCLSVDSAAGRSSKINTFVDFESRHFLSLSLCTPFH